MFAKCQYVPEGNEMRVMQLSSIVPSLDGFTMEYNARMVFCRMSGVLELGHLVVGSWAARPGPGAKRTEGLSDVGESAHQDGPGDQRAARGSTPPLHRGMGQGTKVRAASQGKEGFFSCGKCNSIFTLTPPPILFPGNTVSQEGSSSKPSHHEESLAYAKELHLDGGKIKTLKGSLKNPLLHRPGGGGERWRGDCSCVGGVCQEHAGMCEYGSANTP